MASRATLLDVERLRRHAWLADIVYHEEIESTNDAALQLAAASARLPLLVVARHQRAGRGRGDHRWWASDGALTFSILLDPATLGIGVNRWPLVSLVTGLAVAKSVERQLPRVSLSLKWPNDLFVLERKLGGILIETAPSIPRTLVIGIGLNVNNRLDTAPADVRARAVSLIEMAEPPLALTDLLIGILDQLRIEYARLAVEPLEQLTDWRSRCYLTGRKVEVAMGTRTVSGICRGIDGEGALRVDGPFGEERCVSGEVKVTWPSS